ncbi:MAG TPA: cytochrome b/b6 domain-containing protein [Rhodocyclaceae bacterium]|nr:cytochrome b/b6 domain-containing protein [Rhodocyclaceae bacterium]
MKTRILVWDFPTRVFHWIVVVCYATAWLTSGIDRLQKIHITCGYTVFGLMLFRVLWGFKGPRYARFAQFVRSPKSAIAYLASLKRGDPQHFTGHNPAGAIAILALIALGLITPVFGWITFHYDLADEWAGEIHHILANTMLAIIGVHLLGVAIGSKHHGENLAGAMFSGYKQGGESESIPHAYGWLAVLIAIAVALLWAWSFGSK